MTGNKILLPLYSQQRSGRTNTKIMQPTMRLQGIGLVAAQPAENIKVGDVLVWNYGATETVVSVAPKGNVSLSLVISYKSYGGTIEQTTRTLKKSRLVCIRGKK